MLRVYLTSVFMVSAGHASGNSQLTPDEIQMKMTEKYEELYYGDKYHKELEQGAFDLEKEVSTIVSVATKPLLGTSPGLRTIAMVNNEKGILKTCSSVSVYYQIIDIDGDWDQTHSNLTDISKLNDEPIKTSDTIIWKLIPSDNGSPIILDKEKYGVHITENNVTLEIPPFIKNDKGEKVSTVGMKLAYSIRPYTMLGSVPRTYAGNENILIDVDDITQGKFLEPGKVPNSNDKSINAKEFTQSIRVGKLDYVGLSITKNKQFISDGEIQAGNEADCGVISAKPVVKIFSQSNKNLDLLGVRSQQNQSIEQNLEKKPRVFVKDKYFAEIEIPVAKDKTVSLTADEYNNSFKWKFYYPIDEKCLKGKWNNPEEPSNISASCLNVKEINANDELYKDKLGADFKIIDGKKYLDKAWIKLQKNNDDDPLITSTLEKSEQGAFITISFSFDK